MATLPTDSYSATGKPLWLAVNSTDFGSPQNVLDNLSYPTTALSTIVTNVSNVQKGITQLDDFPLLGTPSVFLNMENNTSTFTPQFSLGFGNASTVVGTTTKLTSTVPLEITGTNTLRIEEDAIAFRPGTIGNATIDFASNYIGLLGGYVDVQPNGLNVNGSNIATRLNETSLIFSQSNVVVAEIAQSGTALNFGLPGALTPTTQMTPSNTTMFDASLVMSNSIDSNRLTIDSTTLASSYGTSIILADGLVQINNRLQVTSINALDPLNQSLSAGGIDWNTLTIGPMTAIWTPFVTLPSTFATVAFPVTFANSNWTAVGAINGSDFYGGTTAMVVGNRTNNAGSFAGGGLPYNLLVIGAT